MGFSPSEQTACEQLARLALAEDLNEVGDLTSAALIPPDLPGRAVFVARADGVLAGLPAARLVCQLVDARLQFVEHRSDGTRVSEGTALATVSGPMASILTAERTALNFLQRLSGVASQTALYALAVQGTSCRLLDTRKTTPGWRQLEKYAVRQGGGHNHRMGLYDGVLIKDNHVAALGGGPDGAARAVLLARERYGQRVPIEVEVDTLDQLVAVLPAGPDIVLLDNMTPEQLREAVHLRNGSAPGVQLEASGGVTLSTLTAIAASGVDRVSVGALTHSARALDIALDYLPPAP
ncbi:MAG: carboxylating nicotinate-nucleotide diphosphorylase [Gemmataceae bacterium]